MVEYALVVALIATVCIVGFTRLGASVNKTIGDANGGVEAASQVATQIGAQVHQQMANAANNQAVAYQVQ